MFVFQQSLPSCSQFSFKFRDICRTLSCSCLLTGKGFLDFLSFSWILLCSWLPVNLFGMFMKISSDSLCWCTWLNCFIGILIWNREHLNLFNCYPVGVHIYEHLEWITLLVYMIELLLGILIWNRVKSQFVRYVLMQLSPTYCKTGELWRFPHG